ncbi:MAG: serine/threonine protein kinase [Proteobacteria bacterium]|nr:serine/threonine protein kinase [Pseudomonadota bacterium]
MTGQSHLGRWLRGADPSTGASGQSAGLMPRLRQPLEFAVAEVGATSRRASLKPGASFAGYRIERELGHGAMANVYRARDERTGRIVALKLLSLGDDWPEDRLDEARLRLLREAEAASRIQHPDIVGVYEAGEHAGLVYLAMEFVEGVSLGTHTYEGRLLPPRMVTEMCGRVADALQFAHQRGVVHRDIKPANIIFDQQSRRIRIMDFGVARFSDSHMTRTGIVLGSPSYMAPEQFDGRPVAAQSDLFSLGVSLFQLLTGQLPFRADSMPGLMLAIATQPHPPLRTIRPDLPGALGAALDRAMQKEPPARFGSAAEMALVLHDCARAIDPGLR